MCEVEQGSAKVSQVIENKDRSKAIALPVAVNGLSAIASIGWLTASVAEQHIAAIRRNTRPAKAYDLKQRDDPKHIRILTAPREQIPTRIGGERLPCLCCGHARVMRWGTLRCGHGFCGESTLWTRFLR